VSRSLTAIRAGMVLGGEYEIVEAAPGQLELGSGAMGAVYLAKDRTLSRKVVIKTIQLKLIRGEDERRQYLARFGTEAMAAASCSHAALVTLYRASFDDPAVPGLAWYAMEHIEGAADLESRLEACVATGGGSGMLFPEICTYLTDATEALREIHVRGIIHRDIKLPNFIVYQSLDGRRLKLLDFGVAHLPESELTRTGQILGTPRDAPRRRARQSWLPPRWPFPLQHPRARRAASALRTCWRPSPRPAHRTPRPLRGFRLSASPSTPRSRLDSRRRCRATRPRAPCSRGK